RHHPDCSEGRRRLAVRSPREHEQHARTTDATGREPRVPRSYGRCLVALYNTIRPHSSLGNLPPAHYAKLSAPVSQRDGSLRAIGGPAPRPVAAPSRVGSHDQPTLLIAG